MLIANPLGQNPLTLNRAHCACTLSQPLLCFDIPQINILQFDLKNLIVWKVRCLMLSKCGRIE
jgi:hypothetical protein